LTLQPSDGGTMYLSASVIASVAIIAIVMPIARRVIPERS